MNWYGISIKYEAGGLSASDIYHRYYLWRHLRVSPPRPCPDNGFAVDVISFQPFNLVHPSEPAFEAMVVAQMEPLPMCDYVDLFRELNRRGL